MHGETVKFLQLYFIQNHSKLQLGVYQLLMDVHGIVIQFRADVRDFSLPQSIQTDPLTHPPSYLKGAVEFFLGVKRQNLESNRSTPSLPTLRMRQAAIPFPHTTSSLHRDNFTLSHFVVGHAVALSYKPEGRGFDSRWCHWKFLLT
jgi:hypothetical protein